MYYESDSFEAFEQYEDIDILHYGKGHLDGGHSGRYPWGSGEDPHQHAPEFLSSIKAMRAQGMSDKDIADSYGLSSKEYRNCIGVANMIADRDKSYRALKLLDEYSGNVSKVAREMGVNESTVRGWVKDERIRKLNAAEESYNFVKNRVDEAGKEGKVIEIGTGVEIDAGISREKMDIIVTRLEMEGYVTAGGRVAQGVSSDKMTTIKVLGVPGTEKKSAFDYDNIESLAKYEHSDDGGNTFVPNWQYPESISSSRIDIHYGDVKDKNGATGTDYDGTIEIRRGAQDLYLGDGVNYAQVRILVDGTHYLKGMAVYTDDLPPGKDIRFNTNKPEGSPMLGDKKESSVLKPISKDDPNDPFGANIKDGIYDPKNPDSPKHGGQSYYYDEKGQKHLSAINKLKEEGAWEDYSKNDASQFLGKQPQKLIDQQIKKTLDDKRAQLDEIKSLTNPTVKAKMLQDFADGADSQAVSLKAASFPGQSSRVIIPVHSLKDNECYAPQYRDGEKVALIRYPHAGTFEIPVVTVNNKNKEAIAKLPLDNKDAIGINGKVAARLSGADFDGDTVVVIPFRNGLEIKSTPALKSLEGFDPSAAYGGKPEGTFVRMTKSNKQNEMGRVSNLITDMTLKGANADELARAVKHSMVVIDAEKHALDYKQSEKDNGIDALKRKYQVKEDGKYGGASTLLSQAKGDLRTVKERKPGEFRTESGIKLDYNPLYSKDKSQPKYVYKDDLTKPYLGKEKVKKHYIDPDTGEKLYTDTHRTYTKAYVDGQWKGTIVNQKTGTLMYKKDGKYIDIPDGAKTKTEYAMAKGLTKMGEAKDARSLISKDNTKAENAYANFANGLKAMANEARKESLSCKPIPINKDAQKTYAEEVKSLKKKVLMAESNTPRERMAQIQKQAVVNGVKKSNPDISGKDVQKIATKALNSARANLNAKSLHFDITDREWEAIQKGAVGSTDLKKIIAKCDSDRLKQLATPRAETQTVSASKISTMKSMQKSGYTLAQIADKFGVSTSTVSTYIHGD